MIDTARQPSLPEIVRDTFFSGYASGMKDLPDLGGSYLVRAALELETSYNPSFTRLVEEGRLFLDDDGSLMRAFEEAADEQHRDGVRVDRSDGSPASEDDEAGVNEVAWDPMMSREERE